MCNSVTTLVNCGFQELLAAGFWLRANPIFVDFMDSLDDMDKTRSLAGFVPLKTMALPRRPRYSLIPEQIGGRG